MNRIAARLVITGAMAICLDSVSALAAANQTDPKFVWPKNSQFTCSGVLAQEQGTYRLAPDQGMLTWCDADIGDKDKDRVLDACKLGDHCEIKGTIRGHGAFGWVEITSVKVLPGADRTGKAAPQLYTPIPGSPERAAIMDAIRLAISWNGKFKVDHLVVARVGNKAVAVADVSDASGQSESGGIFELESLNSQWRALYTVGGGGGADDCQTEKAILTKMIAKAQGYTVAREVFSESFWQLVRQNKSADECVGTVSREF